jgi:diguanylate cyclase (GGDEF)-like protein
MRLIRLGALVGSVVLLVATSVSMFDKRAELRNEQDLRVTAAVLTAEQSIESTVVRAIAVVEIADAGTDPADLTRSFDGDVSACIADAQGDRCAGADLFATTAFGTAATASVQRGAAALTVDESTGSLLVVARNGVTAALRLPMAALIDERATSTITDYGATVDLQLRPTVTGSDRPMVPTSDSGRRVLVDAVAIPGDGGSIVVTASVDDDASLLADGGGMSILLLALGGVLLVLAGWTFLLDRRMLERRATTDELTGLVNRREFERISEESLLAADRFDTGVCLMLIDLNGFKQINDTLGHQFGDVVLQAAADRLRGAVRDTDVVGRWGGDEFVILLPGIEDGTGVRASAERIGQRLAEPPIVGDVSVTAAIGAALFPRHGSTVEGLISAADVAMYSAKTTGVTYRLADAHRAESDEIHAPSGYIGPDRRRQSNTADRSDVGAVGRR